VWPLVTTLAIVAGAFVMLVPFAWMLSTSLKPSTALLVLPPRFVPEEPTVEAYRSVAASFPLLRVFFNSAVVALATTAGQLVVASLSGYAFARFRFRLKELFFYLFLASLVVPGVATLVPLFVNLRALGLLNTYPALILPYAAQALPLTVIILRGFFQSLPPALEDAGRIDGASEFRIFWNIMLPLARSGLITAAVLQFVIHWDELVMAMTFMTDESKKTLPAGLIVLKGQYWTDYPVLAAAMLTSVVPLVVVYIVLQSYFQKGLILGSFR